MPGIEKTRNSRINPQRAPLAILPVLHFSRKEYFEGYQSPTGSTGHFAIFMKSHWCSLVYVSIPNGLHWPFCRKVLPWNAILYLRINPQRAPLAILPDNLAMDKTKSVLYQSPTGSTGHFAVSSARID